MPLFLVFALSSLDFNHHFLPQRPIGTPTSRELQLAPQHWDSNQLRSYGESLRDSLGLSGWFIPWASRSDSLSASIQIEAPMKEYVLEISQEGQTTLTTNTKSLAHLLKIMHFLGEDVPNAPWWLSAWKYYQKISVYAMLFWVASGIYLWWRKANGSVVERRVLWMGMAITSLLIIIVWVVK